MQKLGEGGIWGLFIPGVEEGTMYKFLIYARDGRKLYKADPFANYAEYRPGTASIVTDITGFDWRDSKQEMEARMIASRIRRLIAEQKVLDKKTGKLRPARTDGYCRASV